LLLSPLLLPRPLLLLGVPPFAMPLLVPEPKPLLVPRPVPLLDPSGLGAGWLLPLAEPLLGAGGGVLGDGRLVSPFDGGGGGGVGALPLQPLPGVPLLC
jgi:hypothetical protein